MQPGTNNWRLNTVRQPFIKSRVLRPTEKTENDLILHLNQKQKKVATILKLYFIKTSTTQAAGSKLLPSHMQSVNADV